MPGSRLKKALVTGIAGFIASETARQLMEAGVEVVGVDNMNAYYDPRLKRHRLDLLRKKFDFEFHQFDIEEASKTQSLFKKHKFDAVFNLAARAGVRYSLINPEIYFSANTMGTLQIVKAMVETGVPKMVLASTSSLYAGTPMPFLESAPVNEPISPYAASKKAAEVLSYTYHYHYKIDCTVVRYFTVYGPAGRPDMSIFRFIRWIDEGQPIQLYGDGNQSRDFTFVSDIAAGTIAASKPVGYEIVNLGGGKEPVTLNEVIGFIEKSLGKTAKIQYHPPQKADMAETQANIQKALKLFNWEPKVSLESGLSQSIEWYKNNLELARSISLEEGQS